MYNASYNIVCLRCRQAVPERFAVTLVCPYCELEGVHATLSLERTSEPRKITRVSTEHGIWQWGEYLPVDQSYRVSLGEGSTPLLKAKRLGQEIGVADLWLKDESSNPTWSYKDRLAAVGVSRALEVGAKSVCVASTGNHGAAVAAYAARAGIPCFIITINSIPNTMKVLMQAYGAAVMTVKRHEDRWPIMRLLVEKFGSFPLSSVTDPPAGSNPYAVEGYRTIAYEIAESFGDTPDWIAMPTCYADGLWGVAKGLADVSVDGHMTSRTRMIAAEVAGSLESSISSGSPDPVVVPVAESPAFSINTPRSTHQGLEALRRTNGIAVATKSDDLIGWQRRLAVSEGIFVEAAAVVGLPAVARLRRRGHVRPDDRVVVVLTSSGLKDPAVAGVGLPSVPAIEPNKDLLVSTAKAVYGLNLVEIE